MKRQGNEQFIQKGDLFRFMFMNNPQPMWVYDAETLEFLAVNDAAVAHYGYSNDEFLSMTIKDIRPEEDVPVLINKLGKLGAGISRSGLWKHRTKSGTLIDVEIISHGITYDDRVARFVMVNDATESRRAIEALFRSEEKYRDLFENANDAIFIVSSDFRYMDANKKAVELMGYSKEELLTMKILDVIPPEQVNRSEKELRKLHDRGGYEKFVGKIRTKDGRWLDVEVSSSAIVIDGKTTGSRDIMRDITDRKRMEEELLRAQKLESVGVLAGGLAHDFNNLLTAILGNITLARMDAGPDERVANRLKDAEKAAYRARDLTQQLLTFSRGGAPVKKTVALNGLIKDAVSFALRGANTRCELLIPDDVWPVDADEGQINQVFHNLVINADQAMPEGGKIRVSCSNVTIADNARLPVQPGRYVKTAVADRGIGIPKEHFEKIFDPYFTTKQKGSGLGLATSYSIIKRHGGHIIVESQLGIGSTFHIYIPASSEEVRQEKPEAAPIRRGSGRVLVVDDEEMIRDVASRMLISEGYETESAQDGQVALVMYAKAQKGGNPFDVVILDLTIPGGMGGKETIQKLLEIDPNANAIVSSGYSNDPIMAHFRDYGFRGVASKPYSVKTLSQAVHAVLDRSDSDRKP